MNFLQYIEDLIARGAKLISLDMHGVLRVNEFKLDNPAFTNEDVNAYLINLAMKHGVVVKYNSTLVVFNTPQAQMHAFLSRDGQTTFRLEIYLS